MMKLNEKGADVHVSEEQIFRILEDAIVYDNPNVLERAIVHYGFDVNKPRADGSTLAMLAASFVRPNALRVLEKHGARFDATDNYGRGLLHYICAVQDRYNEARKAHAHGSLYHRETYQQLYYIFSHSVDNQERASLLRFLVKEKGLDVNAKDIHGNTPLTLALKALAKPLVDELVRLGADPCIMNNDFRNSIDIAKECGLDLESLFRSRDTLSL